MFPCLLFLICRLLPTCQSHEGSCSHPTWHLVRTTGVQRARFRVVWGSRTLRITSDFFGGGEECSSGWEPTFSCPESVVPRYPSRINMYYVHFVIDVTRYQYSNVSEGGSGSVIDLPNNGGIFWPTGPRRYASGPVVDGLSRESGETRRRGSVWRTLWASIVARQRDEPFFPLEGSSKGTT